MFKQNMVSLRNCLIASGLLAGVAVINISNAQNSQAPQVPPAPVQDETPAPVENLELPQMELPAVWVDSSFNRHVSIRDLSRGVAREDVDLLTDAALEFLNAERILKRSHKAVTAEQVFQLAMKIAVDKKDQKSLGRLAAAAEAGGDKKLLAMATNARKLASEPRSVDPSLTIDAAHTDPRQLNYFTDMLKFVRVAGYLGDSKELDRLETVVQKSKLLSENQQDQLKKQIVESRNAMKNSESGSAALSQLLGVARQDVSIQVAPGYGTPSGPTYGSWGPTQFYQMGIWGTNAFGPYGGVRITHIDNFGIVRQFGLEINDVILNVNGRSVTNVTDLQNALYYGQPQHIQALDHRTGKAVWLP